MDVIGPLSRWLLGKRVEMHPLIEQWAQGIPRKEATVLGTTAKGLSHSPARGGVLNFLKRVSVPVSMATSQATSDKCPYQRESMEDNSIAFPIIGLEIGPMPTHSQCTKGVRVAPVSNTNNIHHTQGSMRQFCSQSTQPSPPMIKSHLGSLTPNDQELSKSSLWKHIFAPPFTPASARNSNSNTYPYSMAQATQPSVIKTGFSHLYPYAPIRGVGSEVWHMGPVSCGYPSDSCMQTPGVSPCFKVQPTTPMNGHCTTAFSPAPPNYNFAPPTTVPYFFTTCIRQPFQRPIQQAPIQCQRIFVSQSIGPVQYAQPQGTPHDVGSKPCQRQSPQASASPPQYTHRVRVTIQPNLAVTTETDNSSEVPTVIDGVQSLHLSPKADIAKIPQEQAPTSTEVVTSAQSVPISVSVTCNTSEVTITPEITNVELNCDNQQEDDNSDTPPDSPQSISSENQDKNIEDLEECAPTQSSIAQIQSKKINNQLKTQSQKVSSNKDSSMSCKPCTSTPNFNSRKKRKCRPSADKRRRRRMAAVCTTASPQPFTPSSNSSIGSNSIPKKLKTEHNASPPQKESETTRSTTMSATVAFILGVDSSDDEEEDEIIDHTNVKPTRNSSGSSKVKTFCFSISSCSDSDSDFDDVSGDTDNTNAAFDEVTWGRLNFSLDPFNFQCLNSTPVAITKSMSSPVLMTYQNNSSADLKPAAMGPTNRRKSLGKHVKFACDELLETIHTMDDELDAYQEARKGHWELYALDRCRFKNRTDEVEKAISWVLESDHRARVQRQLEELNTQNNCFLSKSSSSSSQ